MGDTSEDIRHIYYTELVPDNFSPSHIHQENLKLLILLFRDLLPLISQKYYFF
jgi:hypothetical protein